MKLNRKNKRYIKRHYKEKSLGTIAKDTGLSKKTVEEYIKKLNPNFETKQSTKNSGNDQAISLTSIKDIKDFLRGNIDFVILLIVICCLLYANSLRGEFVSDDIAGILRNPEIEDLGKRFRSLSLYQIMPTTLVWFFGKIPEPFHVVSVLTHALNTILVLLFTVMVFGKRTALITSLLFAVHPVSTEAVNWISAWGYVINFTFFMMTLIPYVIYKQTKDKKYLIGAISVFVIAYLITTNPWTLIIPLGLGVIDLFILEDKISINTIKIPTLVGLIGGILFLAMTGRVSERAVYVQATAGGPQGNTPITQSAFYTVAQSLKLLFFPKDLTFYHEGEVITQAMFRAMVVVTIIFVITFLFFWKKNRVIAGLLIFIPVSLAPSFSPIQVAWFIADRYLYMATLAFGILVALFILWLDRRYKVNGLALILTSLLVVVFSVRTFIRNNDWKTRKSLWESTVKTVPLSPRVHNNLGDVYALEGNYAASIRAFQTAIALDPTFADAYHNLGFTYLQAGDLANAEKYLLQSLEINPNIHQSTFKMGAIEFEKGNYQNALAYFQRTLELTPGNADAERAIQVVQQRIAETQNQPVQTQPANSTTTSEQ